MNTTNNNFDFLRLLFANLVLITHSYALTGSNEEDLLQQITNGYLSWSYIGVSGFFSISGFLILQSFERSSSFYNFLWKRFIRIFPALFVVVFLTTFVMGPVITRFSVQEYFQNGAIHYFISTLRMLFPVDNLPGVFENNPFKGAVNGSLWTIRYEILFYFGTSALFLIKSRKTLQKVLIVTVLIVLFSTKVLEQLGFFQITNIKLKNIIELGILFATGGCFALFKFYNTNHSKKLLILFLCLAVFTIIFEGAFVFHFLIFPIIYLLIALSPVKLLSKVKNLGDFSYGIYIYGFPIQQALVFYFKLNAIELMLVSIPISFAFGIASWYLIEKPFLRYKNKFSPKPVLSFA